MPRWPERDDSEYLGKRFGEWTVIGVGFTFNDKRSAITRCSCGAYGRPQLDQLSRGATLRCKACASRRRHSGLGGRWEGTKDIPKSYYSDLVRGAEQRNLCVEVDINDLQAQWDAQDGACALTGMPLRMGSKRTGKVASVDRINSDIGYTKENIQWVHKDVNRMKNKFDEDYFYEICKRVVEKRAQCQTH